MTDDTELLRRYAEEGSEQAFGELVERYLDLVYSTAVRRAGSDAQLAQDVAQTVFATLARKVRVLPKDVVLGGWLYRHACLTAAQNVRTERRRRVREQEAATMNALNDNGEPAWEHLAPFLDEAMGRLRGRDRDAIVLRYFERRDLRAVGTALGTSEDAARMRVSRALEKLRTFFNRRGLNLSVTALAALLTGHAVTATPVGLATSITVAALAGAATAGTGVTYFLLKLMAASKLKAGVAGALVVAGLVTPLVHQHQALTKLCEENAAFRRQVEQLNRLSEEQARLSKLQVDADELARLRTEHNELLRLRGEVALLRRESRSKQSVSNAFPVAPAPGEPIAGKPLRRESWANVGTDTPEAALETLFWTFKGWERSEGDDTMYPGISSITSSGELGNPAFFEKRIGALLLGEPERITSLEIDPATITTNKAIVGFTIVLDDGSTKSGKINLARDDKGWGAKLYGRGKGDTVELSLTEFSRQPEPK